MFRWSEYERAAFWPRFAQKDDSRYFKKANVKIFKYTIANMQIFKYSLANIKICNMTGFAQKDDWRYLQKANVKICLTCKCANIYSLANIQIVTC